MINLVLVGGMSGTGKTTLIEYLKCGIRHSIVLSYDDTLENLYEHVGFENKEEKRVLRESTFETLYFVIERMLEADIPVTILMDYVFGDARKERLLEVLEGYKNLNIVAVRLDCAVETSYKRYIQRFEKRKHHIGHYSTRYSVLQKHDVTGPLKFRYYKEDNESKHIDSFGYGRTIVINANELPIDRVGALRRIKERLL